MESIYHFITLMDLLIHTQIHVHKLNQPRLPPWSSAQSQSPTHKLYCLTTILPKARQSTRDPLQFLSWNFHVQQLRCTLPSSESLDYAVFYLHRRCCRRYPCLSREMMGVSVTQHCQSHPGPCNKVRTG